MKQYQLTSVAGTFVFNSDVPLGHAKLIRDNIVGAHRGIGSPIKIHQCPMQWMQEHAMGSIRHTKFQWVRRIPR